MNDQWFGAIASRDISFIERNKYVMARSRNSQGQTGLMYSVENGDIAMAGLLLDLEAEECDSQGHNALTMILSRPSRIADIFDFHIENKVDAQRILMLSPDMLRLLAARLATQLDATGTLPIVYAIENQHIDYLSVLLDYTLKAFKDSHDQLMGLLPGYTNLMIGCFMLNIQMCEKHRDQMRSTNKVGQTALMISVMVNFSQGVAFLLQNEMRIQDHYGFTALMYSAMRGDMDSIRKLGPQEGDLRSLTGCTASMIAAYYGFANVVSSLRNIGQYRNVKDHQGRSILMYAMVGMPIHQLTNILQECGGAQDNNGKTALMYAAERNHDELCNLLLPIEADILDMNGDSALHYALRTRSFNAAKIILKHRANYTPIDDWSPLMLRVIEIAGEKDQENIEHSILDEHLEKVTADGTTALMLAAILGCSGITKMLLKEAGMQENTDKGGMTALMYAIKHGNTDIAIELVNYEHSLSDTHERTALMYAVIYNMPRVISSLPRAERRKKDRNGITALIYAAGLGNPVMVSLLIEEAGEKDNKGRTALMYALAFNHFECYKYLFPIEGDIPDNTGQPALMYFQNKHLLYDQFSNNVVTVPSLSTNAYSTPPIFAQASSNSSNTYDKLKNRCSETTAPLKLISSMDTIANVIQIHYQKNSIANQRFMKYPWSSMRAIQLAQMCQQLRTVVNAAEDVSSQTPKPSIEPGSSENLFGESLCRFSIDSSAISGGTERNTLQIPRGDFFPNVVLYPCKHFVYTPVDPARLDTPIICPKCHSYVQSYECSTN